MKPQLLTDHTTTMEEAPAASTPSPRAANDAGEESRPAGAPSAVGAAGAQLNDSPAPSAVRLSTQARLAELAPPATAREHEHAIENVRLHARVGKLEDALRAARKVLDDVAYQRDAGEVRQIWDGIDRAVRSGGF